MIFEATDLHYYINLIGAGHVLSLLLEFSVFTSKKKLKNFDIFKMQTKDYHSTKVNTTRGLKSAKFEVITV